MHIVHGKKKRSEHFHVPARNYPASWGPRHISKPHLPRCFTTRNPHYYPGSFLLDDQLHGMSMIKLTGSSRLNHMEEQAGILSSHSQRVRESESPVHHRILGCMTFDQARWGPPPEILIELSTLAATHWKINHRSTALPAQFATSNCRKVGIRIEKSYKIRNILFSNHEPRIENMGPSAQPTTIKGPPSVWLLWLGQVRIGYRVLYGRSNHWV